MSAPLDAEARLRRAAALRALCLRLPHVPTPTEAARARRYDTLSAAPEQATVDDTVAVLAGWRALWRAGRPIEIVNTARRLPAEIVAGDRRLQALLVAAQASIEPPSKGNDPS